MVRRGSRTRSAASAAGVAPMVATLLAGVGLLVAPLGAAHAQALPSFPSASVTVDLREVPVRDVLRWIADETGANLVLSDAVGGTVTLSLTDVDVSVLFREVLLAADLGWCALGDTIEVGTGCR